MFINITTVTKVTCFTFQITGIVEKVSYFRVNAKIYINLNINSYTRNFNVRTLKSNYIFLPMRLVYVVDNISLQFSFFQ